MAEENWLEKLKPGDRVVAHYNRDDYKIAKVDSVLLSVIKSECVVTVNGNQFRMHPPNAGRSIGDDCGYVIYPADETYRGKVERCDLVSWLRGTHWHNLRTDTLRQLKAAIEQDFATQDTPPGMIDG